MLTPYQNVIEKLKNLKTSMNVILRWDFDRKERKKVKIFSKQSVWEGGALRSAASAYFLPSSQYS
jgi:hypothetical protein